MAVKNYLRQLCHRTKECQVKRIDKLRYRLGIRIKFIRGPVLLLTINIVKPTSWRHVFFENIGLYVRRPSSYLMTLCDEKKENSTWEELCLGVSTESIIDYKVLFFNTFCQFPFLLNVKIRLSSTKVLL